MAPSEEMTRTCINAAAGPTGATGPAASVGATALLVRPGNWSRRADGRDPTERRNGSSRFRGGAGATGAAGPTGATGASGRDAGLRYFVGHWHRELRSRLRQGPRQQRDHRFDHVVILTALDDSTTTGNRSNLTIRQIGTPATFVTFSGNGALTDNADYDGIPVAVVASGGTLANDGGQSASPGPTGATGATGLNGATINSLRSFWAT
ncbi:hypothetical protein LB565_08310 [Mesorhizobium sp. CA14]|uniref:hypothetical protein n=1 Tax=Mesorhizobium sp. CA14 TaxID=2876642 RepID=UPI001CC94E7A|nr:hypothetical protein [Mesorhizobium sp. CA14]MBZ9847986.1 hypothetical protein [Mesorhizobium sp. CA14]